MSDRTEMDGRHELLRAIQQQARDGANGVGGIGSGWEDVRHLQSTLRLIDNALSDLMSRERCALADAQHVAEIVAEATK